MRKNLLLRHIAALGHNGAIFHHPRSANHLIRSPSRLASVRCLDIYQLTNKAAIEKERARLVDEMNRGYFADMKELKLHGGKIAIANKTLIPKIAAPKFPEFETHHSDGTKLNLPSSSNHHKASLLCLYFRASAQRMIESWTVPFLHTFHDSNQIVIHEVSFIDSWYLRLSPVKRLLLRMMKKPVKNEGHVLERQVVYAFGDHYYFRKELKILNLLTGYVFLVDKFGKIRWQGFGMASEDELSSLSSCTNALLEEK